MWDERDLITTKSKWYLEQIGFPLVAGVKCYATKIGTVSIVFADENVYARVRENRKPYTKDETVSELRLAVRKHDLYYPAFGQYESDYVELYDGKDWQDSVVAWLGIPLSQLQQSYDEIEENWDMEEIPICQPVVRRT